MIRSLRLFVALVVLLSGLALLPYIGLPSERFSWKQFAGAYNNDQPFKIYMPIAQREASAAPAPGSATIYLSIIAR
jgi:hypothetical protein